jgi:hypothetical protein
MQRAVGLLRALGGGLTAAKHPGQLAGAQALARAQYSQAALEPVAPAVTSQDIEDEWYLRQRTQISLGNRHPHAAVSVWVAPSAVVVGDVDLTDRVRCVCCCDGARWAWGPEAGGQCVATQAMSSSPALAPIGVGRGCAAAVAAAAAVDLTPAVGATRSHGCQVDSKQ